MAHLFVAFEPLTGWRGVEVRERRRGREFAEFVRHLAEDLYPEAEKIRLVVDNLNIHSAASFYELFDAERARGLTTEDRVLLHAGARLVVEHGRDRDLRVGEPVPGQATRAGRARRWEGRREPGARSETGSERASIGASPQQMPERSYADSIHPLSVDRGLEPTETRHPWSYCTLIGLLVCHWLSAGPISHTSSSGQHCVTVRRPFNAPSTHLPHAGAGGDAWSLHSPARE